MKKPLMPGRIASGTGTWPHHYHSQLKMTQNIRISSQEFATAIEWLAHHAYPAQSKGHIRKDPGKAFTDGIEDPAIRIQLLQGGVKTVTEALRQALELQAILLGTINTLKSPHHALTVIMERANPTIVIGLGR